MFKPGDRIMVKVDSTLTLRKVSEISGDFVIDEFAQRFSYDVVRHYKPYFDDIRLAEEAIKAARLALLEEVYNGNLHFSIHDSGPYHVVGQTNQFVWYSAVGRDHLPPDTFGKTNFKERFLSGTLKPIEPKE